MTMVMLITMMMMLMTPPILARVMLMTMMDAVHGEAHDHSDADDDDVDDYCNLSDNSGEITSKWLYECKT